MRPVPFSTLVGLTLVQIDGKLRATELKFTTSCGRTFRMYHEQDCCESVYLADIVGDLQDLIGSPILLAECTLGAPDIAKAVAEALAPDEPKGESETWTFYKLATIKGYVDLRWYGSSNGYYSERVDFVEII